MTFIVLTGLALFVLFLAPDSGSSSQRLFLAATLELSALAIVGFSLLSAKDECGSFLVISKKQIVWWAGVAPAERNAIDIGPVTEMWIEANGDLHFCTMAGECGVLPSACMEDDDSVHHARKWAEKLQSYFPGIVLRQPAQNRTLKQRIGDWARGGNS